MSIYLPYYAYLYEKAPDAEIPVVAKQCKPGVSYTTASAAAALAAAMAERAITIYQTPPPATATNR